MDLLHELFLIEAECGASLQEWKSATGSQWLGCARLTGQELSTGVVFLCGSSCVVLSSSFGGVWRLRVGRVSSFCSNSSVADDLLLSFQIRASISFV